MKKDNNNNNKNKKKRIKIYWKGFKKRTKTII